MERWGKHKPLWTDDKKAVSYDCLRDDVSCDILVVGGGITGLTSAVLLQRTGQKVICITDGILGGGTTGSSTGHLTQVQDYSFQELVGHHGESTVKRLWDASGEAIDLIEDLSDRMNLQDSFCRLNGFKFSEGAGSQDALREEWELTQKLGIDSEWTTHNPFSFPIVGGITFSNQAQFDPLQFVIGLAHEFVSHGGSLYENTRALEIQDGRPAIIQTEFGSVKAENVILATHSPVGVYVSLHTRVAPYFSYVMGVRINQPPIPSLYWDTAKPYHYLRPSRPGSDLWIIGGEDHKTGQALSTYEKYLELEGYIQSHFDVKEIEYYWGDEFYEPVDNLPYIGKIPFTNSLYTGTGFSGTGLTYGALAGGILSDLLSGKTHPYFDLFDPSRIKPVASAPNFIKENINVAKWMVGDLLTHPDSVQVHRVPLGEGRIVEVAGHKMAIYRDELNHIHALSPTCTHMGCSVNWNAAEKTWDCPCHGGRFRCTGEAFEGPPLKDLESMSLESEEALPSRERTPSREDLAPMTDGCLV